MLGISFLFDLGFLQKYYLSTSNVYLFHNTLYYEINYTSLIRHLVYLRSYFLMYNVQKFKKDLIVFTKDLSALQLQQFAIKISLHLQRLQQFFIYVRFRLVYYLKKKNFTFFILKELSKKYLYQFSDSKISLPYRKYKNNNNFYQSFFVNDFFSFDSIYVKGEKQFNFKKFLGKKKMLYRIYLIFSRYYFQTSYFFFFFSFFLF